MKRSIVAILVGLVIGGATFGPLAASAEENLTLRRRVVRLEHKVASLRQEVDEIWLATSDAAPTGLPA